MGIVRTITAFHRKVLLAAALVFLCPSAVMAQAGPGLAVANPAEQFAIAPGGVDMRTGRYVYNETDISVGDLALTRNMQSAPFFSSAFANFSHEWSIGVTEKRVNLFESNYNHGSGSDYRITVHRGGLSDTFDTLSTSPGFSQATKSGYASLSVTGALSGSNAVYTYRSTDGTNFEFLPLAACGSLRCALVSKIIKPDGTTFSFNYSASKLTSVVSSRGYAILLETNGGPYVTKACALNLAVIARPATDVCPAGAQATSTYSYVEYSGTRLASVTGPDGQVSGFTYGTSNGAVTMGFVKPGAINPWLTNRLGAAEDVDGYPYDKTDAQTFADGQSYTYAFEQAQVNDGEVLTIAGGTVTDVLGGQIKVKYGFPIVPNTAPHPETCSPPPCTGPTRPEGTQAFGIRQHTPGPIRITDQLGRVTLSEYCSLFTAVNTCVVRPLVSFTDPGGNKTQLTYGLYDNVIEVRRKPKAGSTPLLPDIVTSATYDCINYKSCAKPGTVTDANQNVTRYTYSPDHGGVLTETGPAVPTRQAHGAIVNVRPQKRYTYEGRSAWVKNDSGGYAKNDAVTHLLIRESFCRTGEVPANETACKDSNLNVIANDEVVTEYDYGPDSGPNTLLLRGTTVTADGQTLRTCFTYDDRGNKLSETLPAGTVDVTSCPATPPMAAAAHMTAYRYDADNRLTGTIAPDPDNAGALKFPAVRNTYTPAGDLQTVEHGDLAAWQPASVAPAAWTGFTRHRRIDYVYDASGRKTAEIATALGAVRSVTHFRYDLAGRLICTARRMNSATWLPAPPAPQPDACVPLPDPSGFGPDRITKNIYDEAGQLLQVRHAVGTSDESADTFRYTPNGKRELVIDGRGNKAELRYDGQDRLARWVFPSVTPPTQFNDTTPTSAVGSAGGLNELDYEDYRYDANGNREKLRKRDGSELTYIYDALNRMQVKIVPERTTPANLALAPAQTRDVYYAYDLRGLQTEARFDGENGEGIVNRYDGFGRLFESTSNMGGTSRTLSYVFDRNGARRELTWPDGVKMSFTYDGLNRMTGVRRGAMGSTETAVTMSYNNKGERVSLAREPGDNTAYTWDGLGRLSSYTDAFIGGSGNSTSTFAHSPASQIVSVSRSNDDYAWEDHYNIDRAYTSNGLNQYTAAGGANFQYDPNGNLIQTPAFVGVNTYLYDIENRLVQAGGAANASLVYDPLGRLFQVSGGSAGATRFLYDGDELVAEYDSNGTMLRRYVHGAAVDDPLIWYEGNGFGVPRYLHTDHQGSITAIATGAGNILHINKYDEYGIPLETGNVGRFQYTGQAWIPELEMYHYKARIYSPWLGRFMQTDPIGYEDQINLYAYVANDPVNVRDPSGKQAQAAPIVCAGPQVAGCAVVLVAATACLASNPCRETVGKATEAVVDGLRGVVDRLFNEDNTSDEPNAPPANDGNSRPHGAPDHDAAVDADIRDMREKGYTDIRKNQAQVDARGNKVGNNRPDAQGTSPEGRREVREQDRRQDSSRRHGEQIEKNDPEATCILGLLCF